MRAAVRAVADSFASSPGAQPTFRDADGHLFQVMLTNQEGDLARCEPKHLRYWLLHVAGRITRSERRIRLHLPARWPWAADLLAAFSRLRSSPAPG